MEKVSVKEGFTTSAHTQIVLEKDSALHAPERIASGSLPGGGRSTKPESIVLQSNDAKM